MTDTKLESDGISSRRWARLLAGVTIADMRPKGAARKRENVRERDDNGIAGGTRTVDGTNSDQMTSSTEIGGSNRNEFLGKVHR